MQNNLTVYNKNYVVNDSFIKSLCETTNIAWKNKWLIWINFKKDFFARYKQSSIGIFWALIVPIIPMSVFIFLGYIRVIKIEGDMPFALYIISGMTFWGLISGGIKAAMSSIQSESALLTKIQVPLIVIVLSKYGHVFADTMTRLTFLTIVLIGFRILPDISIILLPIVMMPLLFLSLGVGIILGIFNALNRDIEYFTDIILTYCIWISSVIFPMPYEGALGAISKLNILNHLIVGIRNFVIFGQFRISLFFLVSSFISLIIFIFSIKFQHAVQYKLKGLL